MPIDLKQIATSLNDYSFSTIIPSTGEKINGRPYTIRDEFKLAQIQSSKNKKMMYDVLFELIKEKYYSLTSKQVNNLTVTDVMFLLIKLKEQSDDPKQKIIITCPKCEKEFEHDLALNEIIVENKPFKHSIKIVGGTIDKPLSITFKILSFDNIRNKYFDIEDTSDAIDKFKEMWIDCIDSVSYGDETKSDFTKDELSFFIEKIPRKYYPQIKQFIDNPPEMKYNNQVKCSHCGSDNIIAVDDFFLLFL